MPVEMVASASNDAKGKKPPLKAAKQPVEEVADNRPRIV